MSTPHHPDNSPGGGFDPREEQRLRDLLDHATSDVEPAHGLDAITSRTKVRTMSPRPWFLGAAAAVVATAATVTAVAVLGNGGGTSSAPEPGPAASSVTTEHTPTEQDSPTPDESSDPPSEEPVPIEAAVPVYYVGDTGQGPRLYREFHPGIGAEPLGQALADAVSRTPDDPDYRTVWPAGTEVSGSFDGIGDDGLIGIAVTSPAGASLRDRPAGMSRAEAEMAVQQLVYTAQAAVQSSAPVEFRLDGDRTDQLLGVPTAEPLARADQASTLAQVWILGPVEGAEVHSGFEVTGIGAFFEANVVWELHEGSADGEVVASSAQSGPVTAEECCTMAPYSFTVEAPPGRYTLVVRDEDVSGGEGPPPFQDTKQLTVTD